MHLKRLELFGFKSFADRTVMDFDGNRMTGIVGPNGCGKSNVVDAVRWVLGETRPTSMRGTGMTDVIFKGSASRPPLQVAEVTLVLDNQQEELEGRGSEVAITRRLYKDGEGEYLLDGARCRLKDIKDMLFDTGLGSRGYSVLEQGRIDAVLSANPQQRRAIFEEAAGTSRYRQRKHETELRLKRVAQDMERMEDVMGELRTRVRSLKIQAGKAERYVEAKREWTEKRTIQLKHKLHLLDAELSELRPELVRLNSEANALREQRAELDAERLSTEEARTRVVGELDQASSEAGRLEGELRALEERREQLALRVASWIASSQEEAQRAENLREQLATHRKELGAMVESTAGLEHQARDAQSKVDALAKRNAEMGKRYKEARQAVEAQSEAVMQALHQRTASQNRVQHLEEAQAPAAERLATTVERFEATKAQLAECQSRAQALAAGQEEHVAKFHAVQAQTESLKASVAAEETTRAELAETVKQAEIELSSWVARRDSLLEAERQRDELGGGTQKLVDAIEAGQGPCTSERLLGVVADHLSIDTRLARALDVVLAERAATLVAEDAHVARSIVDWAGAEKVGQIPVVVPPGLGAPVCPSPSDYALFARYGNGVEGRLSDLVICKPEMRALARALCCDVVVVSSLDVALSLVAQNPAWRFVTPKGELVDAAGLLGGHREITQGAVGRRSEAGDLQRNIDDLAGRLEEKRAALAQCGERLATTQAQFAALQEERDAGRAALAKAESEARAEASRQKDLEERLARLAEDKGRLTQEKDNLVRELEGAKRLTESAERDFQAANERMSELDQARLDMEAERETVQRELNQLQVAKTRALSELEGLRERIATEQKRIEIDSAEIDRAEGRSQNFIANAEAGKTQGEGLVGERTQMQERRAAMDETLTRLRAEERQHAARSQEVRERAEEVQRSLDTVAESTNKGQLQQQRLDLSREDLLTRAHDELQLEEWSLRQDFTPNPELLEQGEALATLDAEVAEWKATLDKIGPVNVDAVEELEEVSERLEFLESEAKDLADARRTLMDTLRTIDEESRRLFLETFAEVRTNFQKIFRQLFGGGKADIELEPDKDVLEAGIEILARPPGREMLNIGLLSGGQRTMTALALLFAVFEARPSPFCVLDEVDAALDDANIDRFLAMLTQFTDTTQFIVVTHNKGTMSAADALYGVTMQVKGVSNFVGVELDNVDEFTPDATGKVSKSERNGSISQGNNLDPESGEPVIEITPSSGGGVPEPDLNFSS